MIETCKLGRRFVPDRTPGPWTLGPVRATKRPCKTCCWRYTPRAWAPYGAASIHCHPSIVSFLAPFSSSTEWILQIPRGMVIRNH